MLLEANLSSIVFFLLCLKIEKYIKTNIRIVFHQNLILFIINTGKKAIPIFLVNRSRPCSIFTTKTIIKMRELNQNTNISLNLVYLIQIIYLKVIYINRYTQILAITYFFPRNLTIVIKLIMDVKSYYITSLL